MSLLKALFSILLTGACLLPLSTAAGEALSTRPAEQSDDTEADLAEYSRQLNSDRFSQRRLASQELSAAGIRALPLLEEVALAADREASARAMAIIQQHFAGGDENTRREAEQHLERIAASDNEFAARRAQEALHPEKSMPEQFHPVFGNVLQGNRAVIQAMPAQQFRIQLAPQAAQVRQVKIQNANGEKTITVVENDRSVTITEKKDSLEVEITEKKGDKEVTEKYSAKNAEELKKKHPAAYEEYKKHNGGGGIRIQGNIQIQANAQPLPAQIRLPNIQQFRRLQAR